MTFAASYRKIIHQMTEDFVPRENSSEDAAFADSLIVADIIWGLVESVLIRPNGKPDL